VTGIVLSPIPSNFDSKILCSALLLELVGLRESLAINAYQTLTSLGLGTTVAIPDDDHLDPLCGLSRVLGFIAGNNILDELQSSQSLDHFRVS
jgi:hypothetical protein